MKSKSICKLSVFCEIRKLLFSFPPTPFQYGIIFSIE